MLTSRERNEIINDAAIGFIGVVLIITGVVIYMPYVIFILIPRGAKNLWHITKDFIRGKK